MTWTSPSLQLRWGPYFRADVADQKTTVDMVRTALSGDGGALITKRHAVQKIASIFDIENIDVVLTEIEKEDDLRRQQAIDQARAEMTGLHGDDSGPGPSDEESRGAGEGGSRRGASASQGSETDD
jgi:hypothetical protein